MNGGHGHHETADEKTDEREYGGDTVIRRRCSGGGPDEPSRDVGKGVKGSLKGEMK